MPNPERRQAPRTPITGHAYVNIEPNNGGIVLNVSEGGLCFHSFDPVQKNGKVRFWFSDHNRRIDADGILAWSDETQKAGLRFTALPPEAREKIREWMSRPAAPFAVGESAAVPTRRPAPAASPSGVVRPIAPGASSRPSVVVAPPAPARLNGFSRGLVTGLLVSSIAVAAFVFQNYRRELGESLIRLGESFVSKPAAQSVIASQVSTTVLASTPAPPTTIKAPASAPAPTPMAAPAVKPAKTQSEPEKTVTPPEAFAHPQKTPELQAPAHVTAPQQSRTEPVQMANTVPPAVIAPPAPRTANVTTASGAATTVPVTSSPASTSVSSVANLAPAKTAPVTKIEPVKQPEEQTETSPAANTTASSELYFEVGKFKNQSQAHVEINKLAQLGFPATSVQKGFLWTNSYHILVGPYGDEDRAKITHASLVSRGFKPRPFEKGSRPFTLGSPVSLNGTRTPAGDYILSWESYLDEANVKFLHNDLLVATASGRWVKRDIKYSRDAYVYRRSADGSRTLIEIRFGGTNQALVFGKSS